MNSNGIELTPTTPVRVRVIEPRGVKYAGQVYKVGESFETTWGIIDHAIVAGQVTLTAILGDGSGEGPGGGGPDGHGPDGDGARQAA